MLAITPFFPAAPPHALLANVFGKHPDYAKAARQAPIAVLDVAAQVPHHLDSRRAIFFKQHPVGAGPVLNASAGSAHWLEAHDAMRIRRELNAARVKSEPALKGKTGPLQPEPRLGLLGLSVSPQGQPASSGQKDPRQNKEPGKGQKKPPPQESPSGTPAYNPVFATNL